MSYSTEKTGPDAGGLVLGDVVLDARDGPAQEDEWAAIVVAIAEGDQGALRELYERTHRIVFTLIVRIVKAPATAEEVTLDVYHDVWQRSAAYDRARGTVVAWIMNMARSRAIDRHRREHRQKRVDDGKQNVEPIRQSIELADESQRLLLDHALGALTIDERRAIETAYFQDLTYAEAAERLGEPLGTIKTRIRSGFAKLRTLLTTGMGP